VNEDAVAMEGAEAFFLEPEGDARGAVLLVHGFTGTPQSMRPWGEALRQAGFVVSCPLLPGHGTRWQDMQGVAADEWLDAAGEALESLSSSAEGLFLGGLSMGGAIALGLAADPHPKLRAVATVNAAVFTRDPRLALLPILKLVVPSLPGIANDVADPEVRELAYDRLPLKALSSLLELQAKVRRSLGRVKLPLLVFQSVQDHVVDPANAIYIASHVGSEEIVLRRLTRSYHVATLDVEQDTVFKESVGFFERILDRADS